jgi:outer membrane protein
MFKPHIALVTAAAALGLASVAHADTIDGGGKQAGSIIVDVRATDVIPDSGSSIQTPNGVDTGLTTHVSDSIVPTLGISYFFTDHIAAELVLGTSYHEISAVGGPTNVLVHKTWVLPPILSAQYHFAPKSDISPYVGVGANYMIFYSGRDDNGFTVKLRDGFGVSIEGGVDVALNKRTYLNLDVKKVFFETKATINGGALNSSVHLDPWVPSLGIGFRF